jgi:hypothetical protein|tara:strand:+ start:3040 stop:3453 length:414 start_codon:yes stop_codon:yes gene_type:complete
MTPFDFLKLVHNKKAKWEDFNEDEQKTYNKFIINRALGFNKNYLDTVNRSQRYDLSPKESFKYYQSTTGNKFYFNKWIKGNKDKTYKPELLILIANYLECSCKQTEEYLNILTKKEIKSLLSQIGIQDNEIKKVLKK